MASVSDGLIECLDRLWVELIFPRCEPRALLALRVSCHTFEAQLSSAAAARLWLQLTAYDTRMRHDERVQGWRGVQRAMAREARTRGNCDVGRFERVALPYEGQSKACLHVAGRVVVVGNNAVHLFDVQTGVLAATVVVDVIGVHGVAMDRFVIVTCRESGVLLVDCIAALLVAAPPGLPNVRGLRFTVSGPCVSVRQDQHITVFRIDINGAGEAVTSLVTRLDLPDDGNPFELCERGQSYLNFRGFLQVVDLVTHAIKRDLQCINEPDHFMWFHNYFGDCDFVAGGFASYEHDYKFVVVIRISDGSSGEIIRECSSDFLFFNKGRCVGSIGPGKMRCVDAVSGAPLPRGEMSKPVADASGALLWHTAGQPVEVSGSVNSTTSVTVEQLGALRAVHCFTYGVCVVENERGAIEIVRFDK